MKTTGRIAQLQAYRSQLIELGISSEIVNIAYRIWYRGVQRLSDQVQLEKLEAAIDKGGV
jgi:hypothetical protein